MAQKIGTGLITGASSGIGRELARTHAERGGDLVLVARRADRLDALKRELENKHGVSVLVLAEDLSDEEAPHRIYERVKTEGIEIEYLMNNAGFGGLGRFDQRSWPSDRAMIQVNIVALTALTRLFLPEFVARNSGRILNTSSSAAFTPGPLQAVYYATKAYVTSLSNALAEELSDTNITVTALMPGPVDTEFERVSEMEKTDAFKHASSPQRVALYGYSAMMKGDLDAIAGLSFGQRLMLHFLPLVPKRRVLKMIHKLQAV